MDQKMKLKEEDLDLQELICLKLAISPRRLTKDLKALVLNATAKKGSIQLSLLQDHQKQLRSAEHAKKSIIIPLILYQLFTQNNLEVTLSGHSNQKKQTAKSNLNETQKLINQTPQQFRDNFLKDKKNKSLLAFAQSKIDAMILQKKRNKEKKLNEDIDFLVHKLSFTAELTSQESHDSLLDIISTFLCLLTSLVHNITTKIENLEIKINSANCKFMNFSHNQFNEFSFRFWSLIIELKNVENIQIKLPNTKLFFEAFPLIIEKSSQFLPNKHKTEQSNDEPEIHQLQKTYRLQIEQIQTDQTTKEFDLNFVSKFLQRVPHLKTFSYSIDFMENNKDDSQFLKYENSSEFFKTICEFNSMIENIIFSKIKLIYDLTESQQMPLQSESSQKKYQDDQRQTMDRNIYWMKKMQENCPYLTTVRVDFQKKTATEERKMPEKLRNRYIEGLKATRQVMNLFHKRAMNTQTYFNCIKVMEAQGFDYETILGVLDKINPFAPR